MPAIIVPEIKERYVVDEKGKRVGVLIDPQAYQGLLAELKSLRAGDVPSHKPRGKNGKRRTTTRTRKTTTARVPKGVISEREQAIEVLRSAGMLAELTLEEKALAARWRALPEERKRHVIEKLRTTHFDPPLSESIIQDRE